MIDPMNDESPKDSLVWCPYTDKEILYSETCREHVIPKSLGGVNEFCTRVEKKVNSDLGSSIDARLAEDPRFMNERIRQGTVGHSGKAPKMVFKRAKLVPSNEPVQVSIGKDGLQIWSPREAQYIPILNTLNISCEWYLHANVAFRFGAKVALAAGYYVYGDLLRNEVSHDEIRFIMNFDKTDLTDEDVSHVKQRISNMNVGAEDWLHTNEDPDIEVLRLLSRAYGDASVVGLVPTRDKLVVFVGVLGRYVSLISAPADTTNFPRGDLHDLGHVLVMRKSILERYSLRTAAYALRELLLNGWNREE